MNTEERILSLLEKMYIDFSKRFENLQTKVESLEVKVENLEIKVGNLGTDVTSLKTNVSRIETDQGEKLRALFDGHMFISDKLDRIEQEVSKHEEIILRRVR